MLLEFHQNIIETAGLLQRGFNLNAAYDRPSSTRDVVFDHELDLVYAPLLTKASCASLVAASELHISRFRALSSDGRFGAAELLIRELDPQIESNLVAGIARFFGPISWAFWRMLPVSFSPPFLVRYDCNGVSAMSPHHDFQSDISFSVALNSDFSGGGLRFVRQNKTLPHCEVGKVLVFPGKVTHLHEALPVTAGTRYVLTIWARHKEQVPHA